MNEPERLTPTGAEIVEALTEFYEALERGPEAVAKRFLVRTIDLSLTPRTDTDEEPDGCRPLPAPDGTVGPPDRSSG